MLIDDLIKRLERIREIHGNIRVVTDAPDYIGSKYYELDERAVTVEEGYTRGDQLYWRDVHDLCNDEGITISTMLVIG